MPSPVEPSVPARNGADVKPAVKNGEPYMRSPSLLASLRYAYDGMVYAFRTQRNFKIHIAITVMVIVAGLALQLPLSEWEGLAIVIALVIQTELTNTAVEAIVDRISPEYHELAKVAKDCSAAAVLVTAIAAVIVGIAIFGHHALALFAQFIH
ncbi:MAG: diacylglycerol kinase family protein [Chloroflexi bacterium]|nr:diacylglycerol kinase family protein [Chloroflexota bacterium]MCL5274035.1 diacylglycerol kinase family protein [Chloroflexota bacterium]